MNQDANDVVAPPTQLPQIDPSVFLKRVEKKIAIVRENMRERMLLGANIEYFTYLGTALGLLTALRVADVIDDAELARRRLELTAKYSIEEPKI